MTELTPVLIGLAALLVSALGGWPLTAAVLRWAARSPDAGTDPAPTRHDDGVGEDAGASHGAADDAVTRPPEHGPEEGRPTAGPSAAEPRTGAAGAADPPGTTGATDTHEPARAVLRGGTWIGLLERLAVTGTLALGYPEGIAFVIAVKGLGRYPELREHPGLSERFVIGTLASLGWATALGAAARALVV